MTQLPVYDVNRHLFAVKIVCLDEEVNSATFPTATTTTWRSTKTSDERRNNSCCHCSFIDKISHRKTLLEENMEKMNENTPIFISHTLPVSPYNAKETHQNSVDWVMNSSHRHDYCHTEDNKIMRSCDDEEGIEICLIPVMRRSFNSYNTELQNSVAELLFREYYEEQWGGEALPPSSPFFSLRYPLTSVAGCDGQWEKGGKREQPFSREQSISENIRQSMENFLTCVEGTVGRDFETYVKTLLEVAGRNSRDYMYENKRWGKTERRRESEKNAEKDSVIGEHQSVNAMNPIVGRRGGRRRDDPPPRRLDNADLRTSVKKKQSTGGCGSEDDSGMHFHRQGNPEENLPGFASPPSTSYFPCPVPCAVCVVDKTFDGPPPRKKKYETREGGGANLDTDKKEACFKPFYLHYSSVPSENNEKGKRFTQRLMHCIGYIGFSTTPPCAYVHSTDPSSLRDSSYCVSPPTYPCYPNSTPSKNMSHASKGTTTPLSHACLSGVHPHATGTEIKPFLREVNHADPFSLPVSRPASMKSLPHSQEISRMVSTSPSTPKDAMSDCISAWTDANIRESHNRGLDRQLFSTFPSPGCFSLLPSSSPHLFHNAPIPTPDENDESDRTAHNQTAYCTAFRKALDKEKEKGKVDVYLDVRFHDEDQHGYLMDNLVILACVMYRCQFISSALSPWKLKLSKVEEVFNLSLGIMNIHFVIHKKRYFLIKAIYDLLIYLQSLSSQLSTEAPFKASIPGRTPSSLTAPSEEAVEPLPLEDNSLLNLYKEELRAFDSSRNLDPSPVMYCPGYSDPSNAVWESDYPNNDGYDAPVRLPRFPPHTSSCYPRSETPSGNTTPTSSRIPVDSPQSTAFAFFPKAAASQQLGEGGAFTTHANDKQQARMNPAFRSMASEGESIHCSVKDLFLKERGGSGVSGAHPPLSCDAPIKSIISAAEGKPQNCAYCRFYGPEGNEDVAEIVLDGHLFAEYCRNLPCGVELKNVDKNYAISSNKSFLESRKKVCQAFAEEPGKEKYYRIFQNGFSSASKLEQWLELGKEELKMKKQKLSAMKCESNGAPFSFACSLKKIPSTAVAGQSKSRGSQASLPLSYPVGKRTQPAGFQDVPLGASLASPFINVLSQGALEEGPVNPRSMRTAWAPHWGMHGGTDVISVGSLRQSIPQSCMPVSVPTAAGAPILFNGSGGSFVFTHGTKNEGSDGGGMRACPEIPAGSVMKPLSICVNEGGVWKPLGKGEGAYHYPIPCVPVYSNRPVLWNSPSVGSQAFDASPAFTSGGEMVFFSAPGERGRGGERGGVTSGDRVTHQPSHCRRTATTTVATPSMCCFSRPAGSGMSLPLERVRMTSFSAPGGAVGHHGTDGVHTLENMPGQPPDPQISISPNAFLMGPPFPSMSLSSIPQIATVQLSSEKRQWDSTSPATSNQAVHFHPSMTGGKVVGPGDGSPHAPSAIHFTLPLQATTNGLPLNLPTQELPPSSCRSEKSAVHASTELHSQMLPGGLTQWQEGNATHYPTLQPQWNQEALLNEEVAPTPSCATTYNISLSPLLFLSPVPNVPPTGTITSQPYFTLPQRNHSFDQQNPHSIDSHLQLASTSISGPQVSPSQGAAAVPLYVYTSQLTRYPARQQDRTHTPPHTDGTAGYGGGSATS